MANKSKLFIFGKTGRMGLEICSIIKDYSNIECIGGRSSTGDDGSLADADVLLDFSHPNCLLTVLGVAVSHKKPLVIGTTGFSLEQNNLIKHAAKVIPIVQASNTSLGIAVLAKISHQVAQILDHAFDIEISETHHRYKVDAPSGTALTLANAAAKGRGLNLDQSKIDLNRPTKRDNNIGFSVRRGGGVIGDHTVAFIAQDEMIELSHRGLSRSLFARGAIRASLWIRNQPAGLYAMTDILGI